MSTAVLTALRDLVQEDVAQRGLRTDPRENLVTACAGDFEEACRSLTAVARPALVVVTGFYIAHADPPCGETDGPLGALFLARALTALGGTAILVTDAFCVQALAAGLRACALEQTVPLLTLPPPNAGRPSWEAFRQDLDSRPRTHLLALERVGPSHTLASLRAQGEVTPEVVECFTREVPPEHQDRCHSMRGRDITAEMSPAYYLFEAVSERPGERRGLSPPSGLQRQARRLNSFVQTIGIGDGGNEIGMGKIAWDVIRRNIPNGARVACRVPADHLIVAGVSNWGAYALAAGVALLVGRHLPRELFDPRCERELLRVLVEQGPLVDGVTGRPTVSVDGLAFEEYARPLHQLRQLTGS